MIFFLLNGTPVEILVDEHLGDSREDIKKVLEPTRRGLIRCEIVVHMSYRLSQGAFDSPAKLDDKDFCNKSTKGTI